MTCYAAPRRVRGHPGRRPAGGRCGPEFGNPVYLTPSPDDPPGCMTSERMLVQVRFRPVNRRDVAYVIERTSTTPLDADRQPLTAEADTAAVPVAYIGGGEDFFVPQVADGLAVAARAGHAAPRAATASPCGCSTPAACPRAVRARPASIRPSDPPCVPAGLTSDAFAGAGSRRRARLAPTSASTALTPDVRPPRPVRAQTPGPTATGTGQLGCCRVAGASPRRLPSRCCSVALRRRSRTRRRVDAAPHRARLLLAAPATR
ncbi:MAG: hypothetical protein R3F43_11735 [bacterium]